MLKFTRVELIFLTTKTFNGRCITKYPMDLYKFIYKSGQSESYEYMFLFFLLHHNILGLLILLMLKKGLG